MKLRWSDVDFELAEIRVNANSKPGMERIVHMQPNLARFLVLFRGKPKEFVVPHGRRTLQRWTRNLFSELGIKMIHQGTRHTFATFHLALHPLGETMQELGYAGRSTLFKYFRGLTKRRRAQAENYFAIAPPN